MFGRITLSLLGIIFIFFVPPLYGVKVIKDLKPSVLLISIDGFRADYFDRFATPSLHEIAGHGVRAKHMKPIFPTKTFPNHYTLVTGLYAEHHGIVGNEIRDPKISDRFTTFKTAVNERSEWWGGEPLWVTAAKQGQRSGTMFWVGSTVEIKGVRPTYYRHFSPLPINDRVTQILEWIDLPVERRPTFLTLYFDQVDHAGHEYGPDSSQVKEAVDQIDSTLGTLMKGLKARGISEKINIIVVSDHGMAAIPPEHVISLDSYIDTKKEIMIDAQTYVQLWPDDASEKEEILKKLKNAHPHLKVFEKKDIPSRFHYSDNARIGDILCLADEGWVISGAKPSGKENGVRGNHGYDNELPSMQALFVAEGPAFKKQLVVEQVEMIDLYELMAKILSLKPAPNDGNLDAVRALLAEK
jgi:predicted AlkP superfamily pyrophosphatase or phosphodiesterase